MTNETDFNFLYLGLGTALVLGILLRIFVLDVFIVEGASMEPALKEGSIILLNRAAFGLGRPFHDGYLTRWGEPNPGDVVVYHDLLDGNTSVKRCSAVEGSRSPDQKEKVFLLGDNDRVSLDSRFSGPVPVEKILGKVILAFKR